MDNPPRPEHERANPGCYVPAADSSSMTPYNETYEAAYQTAMEDLEYLRNREPDRNASISTADGSANTRETLSATQHGCNMAFSSGTSEDLRFSASPELPKGFNVVDQYRRHSAPYGTVMVHSVPVHNRNKSVTNFKMTNESNPDHKRSKSKIWGESGKDLPIGSEQDINASSQTAYHNRDVSGIDGQNIVSNYNIAQIIQNENESSRISDLEASKSKSCCSVDESLGVPGPSGCYRKENTPSAFGELFQSFKEAEIPSMKCEEVKSLFCSVCKDEVAKLVTEKNNLNENVCLYYNRKEANILIHSYTHVPKTKCNICEKEHAAENSHNNVHTCPDCNKSFRCRTRLYEHFLVHKDFLLRHCWVCRRKIPHYISEHDFSYSCCVCGFKSGNERSFKNHYELHFPRLFCKLCGEEYPAREESFHGGDFTCVRCPKKFKCKQKLEEHFDEHFFELHKLCNGKMNEFLFRCCFDRCSRTFGTEICLQEHLYSHTGLRAFKCFRCRRRFDQNSILNGHYYNCKILPYKCEICETRFRSIDLLQSHALVKHADIIEECRKQTCS